MAVDAEQLIRDYWQKVWVEADLDALSDVVSEPTIRHTADGTHQLSVTALRARIGDALATICGSSVKIDSLAVVDDMVWARITLHGTTLTTMNPLTITWLAQYRIEGDKIAEMWALHQSGLDWNT